MFFLSGRVLARPAPSGRPPRFPRHRAPRRVSMSLEAELLDGKRLV
jgi:hypothetical protein